MLSRELRVSIYFFGVCSKLFTARSRIFNMITFHLSSQVETFVLNNPAYTRWWCSSSDASSTNRDKLLFGKFSQDVFFNIEYFVPGWYCWEKDKFLYQETRKDSRKGNSFKGQCEWLFVFWNISAVIPTRSLCQFSTGWMRGQKRTLLELNLWELNQLCSERGRKIRRNLCSP